MHSAATQSALHFHVTQILIENPRQHLTTQPVGNIQHRFLSRHFAPTRHIVPFAVLGWDILILLKKIACHRETNPPLSPPFWRYAYACAMVFMTRILSFETDYPRQKCTLLFSPSAEKHIENSPLRLSCCPFLVFGANIREKDCPWVDRKYVLFSARFVS